VIKATTLLIATALAAIALPGVAFAQASAYGSLGLGIVSNSSYDDDAVNGPTVNGLASAAYSFTPELGVQGDVMLNYDRIKQTDGLAATISTTMLDGALHGYYRTDNFLVGGIVQLGRSSIQINDNDPHTEDRRYAGLEGQLYLDNFTLYGQAGVKDLDNGYVTFTGYFGKLEGRYFLTPDFRIEAHVGVGTLNDDNFDDWTTTTVNLGVGAEYKFDDMPFSLFAQYDYYRGELRDDVIGERQRAMVGIRFQIEDDSLMARDRSGPSLEPVEPVALYSNPS
jgi:opacity protein-like surface antigen